MSGDFLSLSDPDARRGAAQALAVVGRVLAQQLDAELVGQGIAEGVRALLGARIALVCRCQPDTGDLVVAGSAGDIGADPRHLVIPSTVGALGLCVRDRRAVVSPDVLADSRITLTPEVRARVERTGSPAALAVPLIVDDRLAGALGVADRAGRRFTSEEIQVAQAFADLATLALENARLYAESTRRRREAEALTAVARRLTETPDVASLGERVVESVCALLGCQSSSLRLLQADGSLVAIALHGPLRDHVELGDAMPPGAGIVGRAAWRGEPAASSDVLHEPGLALTDAIVDRVTRSGAPAVLGVPLRAKGATIGVLSVGDRLGRVYSPADIALAQALADQAALALENARLHEETQQRLAQTETLLAVSQAVGSPLDLTETVRRVARETCRTLGSDLVGVYVPDEDGANLRPIAGYRVPKDLLEAFLSTPIPLRGHRFLEDAWIEQRPGWSNDTVSDPRVDQETVRRFRCGAVLFLPLTVKGTVIGALFVVWVAPRPGLTTAEIRLAEAIASQAASVLASARLYGDLARKNAHLQVLFDTARRATVSLNLPDILPSLTVSAAELIGADGSAILLLDSTRTVLEPVAHHGVSEAFQRRGSVPLGQGAAEHVILGGQPAIVEDMAESTALFHREAALAEGIRSAVVVPLRSRDRIIGTLSVYNRRRRPYPAEEVALLEQFANLAAMAIENARLHGATRRREEELGALLRATRTLMGDLDLGAILHRIVDEAARIAGTPHVSLLLADQASGTLSFAAVKEGAVPDVRIPIGTSLAGLVASKGTPLFVPDVREDPRNPLAEADRERGIVTYLGLPVRIRDEIVGILTLNTTEPRRYGTDELAYLASFANQAAIAIRNARLYEEAQLRATRLHTLARLNQVVSSSLDADGVLGEIVRAAAEMMDVGLVSVWVADETTRTLTMRTSSDERFADFPFTTVTYDQSVIGWVARHRRPLEIADVASDSRVMFTDWWQRHGLPSLVAMPIMFGDALLGVLALNRRTSTALTPDDEDLLASFVGQAGVAIRNARLYGESEARRRTAEALAEMGRVISQTLDSREVAQRIADSVRQLFGTTTARLLRLDRESGDLHSIALSGDPAWTFGSVFPAGSGAVGVALREGRVYATSDLLEDPRVMHPPDMENAVRQRPDRAVLAVPLVRQRQIVGVLNVTDRAGRRFGPEEMRLAETLADHAALALENARLFEETERRRRAAEMLAEVARLTSESLEPHEVAQRTVDHLRRLFNSRLAALYRRVPHTDDLVLVAAAGDPDVWNRELPDGTGAVGRALRDRRPVASADVLTDPRIALRADARARVQRSGCRAILAMPLLGHHGAEGALAVGDGMGRTFDGDDIQLAQLFADQVTLALANADLFEEAQARLSRMRRLAQLSHLVTSSLEFQQVLEFVIEAALDLLRTDLASVWILDEATGVARLAAQREGAGPPPAQPPVTEVHVGQGPLGWVLERRQTRQSPDLLDEPGLPNREWAQAHGYVSQLAVPLVAGERAIGVLVVLTRERREFGREDEELLEIFAAKAASALENANLYRRTQEAHAELSRTQEQLAQSQKMEAVGRLAGGIAHDFNNLLTVISGRTQLLLSDLWSGDPLRRHVELVLKTTERASALTHQLLAFSRKQVLRPSVLDLNAIVSSMGAMLRRLIGEDVSFVTVLDPALGRCKADPSQIEQVILNLAVNARDAMPKGGRLTIETGNAELDAGYVAWRDSPPPGRYVMLAVTDTGCGMEPAVRDRIFEPFFTTKERGKGTGLGLSTVYGIIKQSEGGIYVYSEPGLGSTFKIFLPRVEEALPILETGDPRGGLPRGSETVLLVEDEDEVRALAREILEESGYTVLEASRGSEALELSRAHDGKIDLLVTDVVMPAMSGPEVAERLAGTRPDTRVIFMSGYTDDAIAHHGTLAAGTAYLEKPFTPDDLARKVREVLERR
jgi:GAF domain-containing protein/CheY-like chemotaxis protein